jgi:hypothetical protein
MSTPDLEAYWKRLGHPHKACRCGKEVHDDGAPVLWRCQVCGHLVCRDCTLLIEGFDGKPRIPPEYHEITLCSKDCWKSAGEPEE